MILVISIISARRFREGGAAILITEKINHQKVMAGNRAWNPFSKNSLRVEAVW